MPHRHDAPKRHLALWIAVGGTMAVILVLWILILPMQLQGERFYGLRDAARWNTRTQDGGAPATLSEVLAQQRRQLQALEKSPQLQTTSASAKIDELRAKIDAANQKSVNAPSTNAPANP